MSGVPNMQELFAKMQAEEEAKAKKEAEAVKDYNNPNFVNMKQGNAYEFRLMYWVSGVPGDRTVPYIEKTVHAVKLENGEYHEVTCPVSSYLLGKAGYRVCPICTELSKIYKEMESGSAAAKIAYDKFKRKFKGYAVVYVVNDPTTPENNGTYKILYVNTLVNEFLVNKIKGKDRKGNPLPGARPIGFKAYDPSANGKNLLITVTNDGNHNKYGCEFVDPDPTNAVIDASYEKLEKVFGELEFEKYYTNYDPEELKKFYEEVYLEKEAAPETTAPETPKTEATPEKEDDLVMEDSKQTEAAPAEEVVEEKAPVSSDVADIDNILNNLP